MDEDYFFQIEDEITDDRLFILIIYDITNNSKRVKFAKLLLGYGFRIQKSAFEAVLTKTKYEKLKQEIPEFVDKEEDSIRIYQIKGKTQVVAWGKEQQYNIEDIISSNFGYHSNTSFQKRTVLKSFGTVLLKYVTIQYCL